MKIFYPLLIVLVAFLSCSKEEAPPCKEAILGQEFNASQGDKLCFGDDITLELTKVEDHLCPCGGNCVHPGFVSAKLKAVIDGMNYEGNILNHEQILGIENAITLPSKYKLEFIDITCGYEYMCGGLVEPDEFKWTLRLSR